MRTSWKSEAVEVGAALAWVALLLWVWYREALWLVEKG